MFTSNYDQWKTASPEDDNTLYTTSIDIGVTIEFIHDNPDPADHVAIDARTAIMDALRDKLGLHLSDIDISIDGATQECHED